jgi:hypothetical protein
MAEDADRMNKPSILALMIVLASGGLTSAAAAPMGAPPSNRCDQPGPYELPHGDESVDLDPADFSTRIDNPYWPMRPGTTWRYVERGEGEVSRVTVRVTHRTKLIRGIKARVVRDTVRSNGKVVEDTRDWFAQDSGGSIWYLGELSKSYEDGVFVGTEGSWTYGRDGAQAGIVVPAEPSAGCSYREEYLAGEAEDQAKTLSTDESLRTRFGLRHHVLQTANTTPLEPDILENKFYVRGIGPVLELDVSPSLGTAVLVGFDRPKP